MTDSTTFETDAAGRLTASERNGLRETFVYDEHGRLVEHRVEASGHPSADAPSSSPADESQPWWND